MKPLGLELNSRVRLRHYASLLGSYLAPYKGRVGFLVMSMLVSIGLNLLNPQIFRYFIDTATMNGPLRYLIWAGVAFIGIGILRQVIQIIGSYLGQDVGWRVTNEMRNNLALHCLKLDMSFHQQRTPGEMMERVDGDTTALSSFFSQFLIQVLGGVVLLLGVLVLVFFEDWRVGLALTLFSVVALIIINLTRNIAVPIYTEEREGYARLFGFLEERIFGLEDIRTSGSGNYILNRFHGVNRDVYRRVKRSELVNELLRAITGFMYVLGFALAMGMGIWLYRTAVFTIGDVFLIVHYTSMLHEPIFQISRQINELQRATAGLKRIEELHQIKTKVSAGHCSLASSRPFGVQFRQVSFSYDSGERVLNDIDFTLKPGEKLGLLGRTGSGKTSITRLIFRLHEIEKGEIRIGRQSISDVRVEDLRRNVGLVTQDVHLFNANLRQNLTLFKQEIPDEKIICTLRDLGLGRWYDSLPEGLDSEIDASKSRLSAGEAQLLAFTRVFLKDPGLIILDEPSSRLDPATERTINLAVERLLENRTGIIIAHRLETVQKVDRILILENGYIQEHGKRSDLLADSNSHFCGLLRRGSEELI